MTYPDVSRTSPVHSVLQPIQGDWQRISQMAVLAAVPGEAELPLRLVDLSCLNRFGVKGAGAADWLTARGIQLPEAPNSWCKERGILTARLGLSEFLVEADLGADLGAEFKPDDALLPPQVYPVLRQDLAIGLWGEPIYDLLAQTCSFNVRALSLAEQPVLLTTMIGVAVTLLPGIQAGQPYCRIWCDGTFGEYLWRTLYEIVCELGGGIAGIEAVTRLD